MRKIAGWLWQFAKADVKPAYLSCLLALLAFLVCGYYQLGFPAEFYSRFISPLSRFQQCWALLGGVFILAFAVQPLFGYPSRFLRKPGFWLTVLAALVVYSLRSSFTLHTAWVNTYIHAPDMAWWHRCADNMAEALLTVLPLLLFWMFVHRRQMPFYGFSVRHFNAPPYVYLLLLMVPLVALASTQSDFLNQYPKAYSYAYERNGLPPGRLALFELLYGADFVAVELFFRGFLIMALMQYCGRQCILPMACFYVLIHLGKPIGETISSFFGGTILGVLAYESRSIYGGIMVHLGIAWLMEWGAVLGNKFFLY